MLKLNMKRGITLLCFQRLSKVFGYNIDINKLVYVAIRFHDQEPLSLLFICDTDY